MSAAPDAHLSNYRLDRLLGSGGMGSVYLAHDLTLDRPVAIKFISPEKAGDEGARKRLIREARAAASLDHPNICAVHQVIDEDSGRACIVMQYVEGETLADRLRRGPLEPRLALTVACELADALLAAHKRNIIHRDIKPQNIIITNERHTKLLDFGIARITAVPANGEGSDTTTGLTTAGVFIGTPAYMSPEQAQQLPVDRRSDLFALGAVFFECLTGRRAFQGHSTLELFTQVLNEHPPAVSTLRPELKDRFDEVCRRLLAKHPDDRFQSAEELLGALRLLSTDTSRSTASDVPAPVPRPRRTRWVSWAVITSALVSVAAIAAIAPWKWNALPDRPDDGLYRVGTDYLRSGAYDSARRALLEVASRAPSAAVYVRLAEANLELDEIELAKDDLLKARDLPSSPADEIRARAVRALALRKMDEAIGAYRELTVKQPDASAWFDLGRAQDAAALSSDARISYDKAIEMDGENAAAYLRRASLLATEGERDSAMRDFARADQIYETRSNAEGRAEVLLRRGAYLDGIGMLEPARVDLERARTFAEGSKSQQFRAQLLLSSVTASQGNLTLAEAMALDAIATAERDDLDATAADGLVQLAIVLQTNRKFDDADARLRSALELAAKRGALRIAARATVQLASVRIDQERFAEGVKMAEDALPSLRTYRYRRFELKALNVVARGRERLGQFAEARAAALEVLSRATGFKDDAQVGEALESLAGQANEIGNLPEAHDHRLKGESIHRTQKEFGTLAYDITNRADLLIRLGRSEEAGTLLDEVEEGIKKGIDAYKNRARRALLLRALDAAIHGRHTECIRIANQLTAAGVADSSQRLAARLLEYSTAMSGRKLIPAPVLPSDTLAGAASREIRYWTLAGYLAAGDARRTLDAVTKTLADPNVVVSPEFEWRVAAIGAAAARNAMPEAAAGMTARAQKALDRMLVAWKSDTTLYDARPDLKELRRKAGLNTQS